MMMISNPIRLTLLSLFLVAGLAAGCAESMDDSAPEVRQSSEQLVLLSVQQDTPGSPAMNVAYNAERGWHINYTDQLLETNFGELENVAVRHQPLDIDINGNGATSTDDPSAPAGGSRFNTSLAGSASFSANVPRGHGFSSSLAGPTSHSTSMGTSTNFYTGLSSGGQCSLMGICDFLEIVCRAAPNEAGCSGGEIAQCRSEINRASAEIPPEARPFMCAIGNFFTCAGNAITSSGNPEAALERCASSDGGAAFLVLLLLGGLMG